MNPRSLVRNSWSLWRRLLACALLALSHAVVYCHGYARGLVVGEEGQMQADQSWWDSLPWRRQERERELGRQQRMEANEGPR